MAKLTYGRLEKMLKELGFRVGYDEEPMARVFEHQESGAFMVFPIMPDSDTVLPRHLAAVRVTLDANGLPAPTDPAKQLKSA